MKVSYSCGGVAPYLKQVSVYLVSWFSLSRKLVSTVKTSTWCLFGGVIEGYLISFLILRFCFARILFTYICLLEKLGTIAFFRLFEYILSLL